MFVFFFFFFFESIYEDPIVQRAFEMICGEKLLSDGYCDFGEYVYARISKHDLKKALDAMGSPYAVLYGDSYPTGETAAEYWRSHISRNRENEGPARALALTHVEASAIVNWVFRTLKNAEERLSVLEQLAQKITGTQTLRIKLTRSVVYDESRIQIHFFSGINGFYEQISDLQEPGSTLFFRGHADVNYRLLPSILRTPGWRTHEKEMYNQLLINCAADFGKCQTHLDYLVEMQHYGLPTRLLDITRNPLVALYFACATERSRNGEVIVFSARSEQIKFPQSDTVSILASLPLFSSDQQDHFLTCAQNPSLTTADFNRKVDRLLHEVKSEKPAFRDQIDPEDLLSCFVVLAMKNNPRIVKQDGAFILCGLSKDICSKINALRHTKQVGKRHIRHVYLISKASKSKLLKQLDRFAINQASLFPEIDDVAAYIKNQY